MAAAAVVVGAIVVVVGATVVVTAIVVVAAIVVVVGGIVVVVGGIVVVVVGGGGRLTAVTLIAVAEVVNGSPTARNRDVTFAVRIGSESKIPSTVALFVTVPLA